MRGQYTLNDLVHSGKVRYIACSNFSGWRLMKSLSMSEKIARKLALRDLLEAEATDQMVVHKPGRLHQRIDNRRAYEPEAALL